MKTAIKWTILVVLCVIPIFMIIGMYKEDTIKRAKENNQNIETKGQTDLETNQEKNLEISRSNQKTNQNSKSVQNTNLVPATYKGYKVIANLKIDKLNIDTCVLQDFSDKAMQICVTKFFGPEPNEIGNFCITGHNYITKNMFGYLYTLKVGDTFTLTDNKNGTIKYEIYDKYRAKETQTQGLSQKTDGKKEVTLVTCCNYSNDRLIIKAKENL